MAKRVNPHRRLLAAQASVRQKAQAFGNAEDAGKLQEGRVRSGMPTEPKGASRATAPRSVPWEGRGKPGKIVRGRFKPVKPGSKSRFASK